MASYFKKQAKDVCNTLATRVEARCSTIWLPPHSAKFREPPLPPPSVRERSTNRENCRFPGVQLHFDPWRRKVSRPPAIDFRPTRYQLDLLCRFGSRHRGRFRLLVHETSQDSFR